MDLTKIELVKNNFARIDSGSYFLDVKKKEISLDISSNSNVYLFISFTGDNKMHIKLGESAIASINTINTTNNKNIVVELEADNHANSYVNIADFSVGQSSFSCAVNLKQGASCKCHLATVSQNDDQKSFTMDMNHLEENTTGKVECYGVAKDSSKIVFKGTSFIKNKAVKSNTNQIAKAMIFDKQATAVAKPILKIDENDVSAAHAAAVGRVNEEHIYYLTSRGLNKDEAKRLITLGYLRPIINQFDEIHQEEINQLIERSL